MGIKQPLKICVPRPDTKRWPKIREIAREGTAAIQQETHTAKVKANQKKCRGEKCSNQAKRDCDNSMCGRCCRKSQEVCSVHEPDAGARAVTSYVTDRGFYHLEPRGYFNTREDMTQFTDSKKQLQGVVFGPDFKIRDDDIIRAVDMWKEDLVVLELGSSDTGDGVWLTNKALQYIADNCPKLRKLRLESVTNASDDAVIDITRKCPLLEELTVSGHDKSSGALTDRFLKVLFDVSVLPKLSLLSITDQWSVHCDVVNRLRRRRPKLKIVAGETDSDSFAHSLVLGMMGMSYGDGLY